MQKCWPLVVENGFNILFNHYSLFSWLWILRPLRNVIVHSLNLYIFLWIFLSSNCMNCDYYCMIFFLLFYNYCWLRFTSWWIPNLLLRFFILCLIQSVILGISCIIVICFSLEYYFLFTYFKLFEFFFQLIPTYRNRTSKEIKTEKKNPYITQSCLIKPLFPEVSGE